MCACVYILTYMYTYVCMYIYIYAYIYFYTHTHFSIAAWADQTDKDMVRLTDENMDSPDRQRHRQSKNTDQKSSVWLAC